MRDEVSAAVAQALGSRIRSTRPLSGGSINQAFAVDLADGRGVFVKTNQGTDASMFFRESQGLQWLGDAKALRVPEVLAVSKVGDEPQFLALELLEPAPRTQDFDARLGRGLAKLHEHPVPTFGLPYSNFIATLKQTNTGNDSWPDFYRDCRLRPQVELAVSSGVAPKSMARDFERLYSRLGSLVGPPEAPARLHGDLWGGNLHVDECGEPCIIDPAVYGGHREIDLAMMRLFGGFGEAVFSAYNEAFPLAPGHHKRVQLYQLYPLLVHVNLFGGGYVDSVSSALRTYL